MSGEDKLQEKIYNIVKEFIEDNYKHLKFGKGVKIIKDCTFVPSKGKFTLHLGHAETDLAIYKESKEIRNELKGGICKVESIW